MSLAFVLIRLRVLQIVGRHKERMTLNPPRTIMAATSRLSVISHSRFGFTRHGSVVASRERVENDGSFESIINKCINTFQKEFTRRVGVYVRNIRSPPASHDFPTTLKASCF